MKQWLLWIGLMPLLLGAEGVQWRSFEAGLAEAAAQQKLVMVDVVRDYCHYCSDMDEAVFSDPEMAATIEARFVPVRVNLSRETMPLDVRVPMTPTFYFLTPEKKLLKTVPGSWNKEDFKSFLDGVQP
jgi:thioredoxin-related protein